MHPTAFATVAPRHPVVVAMQRERVASLNVRKGLKHGFQGAPLILTGSHRTCEAMSTLLHAHGLLLHCAVACKGAFVMIVATLKEPSKLVSGAQRKTCVGIIDETLA